MNDPTRAGLVRAAGVLRSAGSPLPALDGKLLRPTAASAGMPLPEADSPFWFGALALEMAHEASLLHDDILDGAGTRRGEPTRPVAHALVGGDHLLTASYGAAARCGVAGFLERFIAAVEATVAGEIRQAEGAGRRLAPAEYRRAIEGKAGALFGAALALGAAWRGDDPDVAEAVGLRLGALYQMVDDFLDYCPSADTGKPALQDLRQGKWTFVLDVAGLERLPSPSDPVTFAGALFDPAAGGSAMRRALERLEDEARALRSELPGAGLDAITSGWVEAARRALIAEEATRVEPTCSAHPGVRVSPSVEAGVVRAARSLGGRERWGDYFAHHSRSFRFAAHLFPAEPRRTVEGIYAFCRFTDDLVDEAEAPADVASARLEAWRGLIREGYDAPGSTGVPLVDEVMGTMARSEVPFHYADELVTGVGMDLEPRPYATLADLEVYTYRVASVVGGWLTEEFGVRNPSVLARAFGLGHAMQMTNILRDVGEDWMKGRFYLPTDRLSAHGLDHARIADIAGRRDPLPEGWITLVEELLSEADREYDRAFEALPALPTWYARPVAVAARVYQGINDGIRSNGYDDWTLRAHTSLRSRLRLGVRGLRDLRRARKGSHPHLLLVVAHDV